jgi:hypothetical protein
MGLEEIPPVPTTPTDTTHTTPTDPTRWTTIYGGDASMNNEGYVTRYLLIARQDGKSDSVSSNYNVEMTLEDTIRVHYSGSELSLLGTEQTLYPTGSESYSEGTDHVFRATEETEWNVYCGAVTVPVNITRELAKVVVKGKEQKFEFGSYNFDAEKTSFRTIVDTVENKIYRYDILDGKVHMKQGYGDYTKPFTVVMDRFIGELETPQEPNPMPSCIVVSGKPTFYGTIVPIMEGGKLIGYDNIVMAETSDSLYAVHAATAKVVVKGARVKYPLSSNGVTSAYTAIKVNGSWRIAYVERNQSGTAYIYAWGNSTSESYTVPLGEFVTGGAKNLDEKGNAKQNPFLRVSVSEPKSYDKGYTYTVQAYNYRTMVANLLVGYFK